MIKPNYIEKLLEKVEVKWKTLGEVATIYDGTHQTPKYTNSGVPFVSVQNISDLYATEKYISFTDFEKYKYKPRKDDLFMTRIGDIGTCAVVENDEPLAYYVTLTLIRVDQKFILPKYLKHVIESNIGKSELYKRTLIHATPIKINLGEIGKIIIPIPPIKVQEEIIRILDAFTEHTAELKAELKAELRVRKKQYEYYRDKMLTFENTEIEWGSIEKIFILKNGYTPSKSNKEYWENASVPWFRMEDIRRNGRILNNSIQCVNEIAIKGGNLFPENSIIVATSATIGEHALITVPYLANQRFTNLSLKENYKNRFSPKYLFYYCFLLDDWCKKNTKISSFPSVDMRGFRKFKFPIPTLTEQERIVSLLDKFDTLTSLIIKELSCEIELRQKQYEYYRNLLLSFPKEEVEE
ncbi:restriction endonuclease subunit S [Paenibacillus sp. Z6-24]